MTGKRNCSFYRLIILSTVLNTGVTHYIQSNAEEPDGIKDVNSVILDNDFPDLRKRLSSDYGYGSRVQAGETIARDIVSQVQFGIAGPGKRSTHVLDISVPELNDGLIEKRTVSDYGYGSRILAAEDIVKDWKRKTLFGAAGPGKRAFSGFDKDKHDPTDFRLGSRADDARYFARLSTGRDLFSLYGQDKIPSGYFDIDAGESGFKSGLRASGPWRAYSGYGSRIDIGESNGFVGFRRNSHASGPWRRTVDTNRESTLHAILPATLELYT